MRSASGMSARRRAVALARGYGTWKAFHDACAEGRRRATTEARAEMDALDQIGDTVIDAHRRLFRRERTTASMVERLTSR